MIKSNKFTSSIDQIFNDNDIDSLVLFKVG